MDTRKLGNSDLLITPIGFGAWAIGGGGWEFSWGPQDDVDSIAAIHEALDCGINWIDTAAVYGLGHSEEVVADALEGVQQRPFVFTKCGRVWGADRKIGKRLTAASIRQECEASLKRLRVETIDLYQMHWPEPDEDIEEGWSTMAQLKAEGKVRWIGVSNYSVAQMERIAAIAPDHLPAAALLPAAPRHRDGCSPLHSSARHWRPRLFAHGVRPSHWRHDARAPRCLSCRRLAAQPSSVSGAAVDAQSALRRAAADHRRPAGPSPGRGGGGLGAARQRSRRRSSGAPWPGQLRGLIGAVDLRLSADELTEIETFLRDQPG